MDNLTSSKLQPTAAEYQQDFPTYCEISPSGKGLRLIGLGSTPADTTKPIEIYSGNAPRFLTVTGRTIGQSLPVSDIGASATAWVKKYKSDSSTPPPADMPELIEPEAGWPEITFEPGADRSAAVLGEANKLYLKGRNDQEVLSILWNSPEVSAMALEHWNKQPLEYLWKHVCAKARENLQPDYSDVVIDLGAMHEADVRRKTQGEAIKKRVANSHWTFEDLIEGTQKLIGESWGLERKA